MPKCVKNMCVKKLCVWYARQKSLSLHSYVFWACYVCKEKWYKLSLHIIFLYFVFVCAKIKICSREYVISAYNLKKYEENKEKMKCEIRWLSHYTEIVKIVMMSRTLLFIVHIHVYAYIDKTGSYCRTRSSEREGD